MYKSDIKDGQETYVHKLKHNTWYRH